MCDKHNIETVLTKREWPAETCVRPFEPLDRVHKGGCQGTSGQKDLLDSAIEAHIFFSRLWERHARHKTD